MAWDEFVVGEVYRKDHVVEDLRRYVNSARFKGNRPEKLARISHIERTSSDWLKFQNRGERWGKSPLNENNWLPTDEPEKPKPAVAEKPQPAPAATADSQSREGFSLPEELSDEETYLEGSSHLIQVNAYERDPEARRSCIEHYGAACCVCDFDFLRFYGELGRGYIHVHHLTPLSEIGEQYLVDPIQDLRPVCPNCHAMLHRRRPCMTIEELHSNLKGNCGLEGA